MLIKIIILIIKEIISIDMAKYIELYKPKPTVILLFQINNNPGAFLYMHPKGQVNKSIIQWLKTISKIKYELKIFRINI